MVVDVETAEELVKAKQKINLYVHDLNINQKTLLKSCIAKEFNPKWISDGLIELTGPTKKRERIVYKK